VHTAQASEVSCDTSDAQPTYLVNRRKLNNKTSNFILTICLMIDCKKRKDALGHSLRPPQPEKNTAAGKYNATVRRVADRFSAASGPSIFRRQRNSAAQGSKLGIASPAGGIFKIRVYGFDCFQTREPGYPRVWLC
jgi:hypothetical protein